MVDYRNDHLSEPLDEAAMEQFATSFRGELVHPEDGYHEVRKVYYGMIDKRPLLIVWGVFGLDKPKQEVSRPGLEPGT